MLRILVWLLASPENMISLLQIATDRLETYSMAKEAERANYESKMLAASAAAAKADALAGGLIKLVG